MFPGPGKTSLKFGAGTVDLTVTSFALEGSRTGRGLLMTTGTLFLACLLLAANPGPPDADFLNQRGFKIPTRIDPSRRGEIRELELYVSTNQGQGWSKASAVSPDSPEFEFNAPNDGLYWFCVLVVDQQGRKDPPDPYSAKEFLKLYIDTVRPDLRIVAAERQGDDVVVKWEVREENPDPASVKLEYRTVEMPPNQWSPVPLPAAGTMQVAFRPGSLGAVQLRMQAQDLAHNAGIAQTEVAAVVGTASFAPPPGGTGPPIAPPPPPAIAPKSVPAMPASQEKQPPPPTFAAGPSDVSPPVAGP